MCKLDLGKLFPPPPKGGHNRQTKRTYDVRITINRAGKGNRNAIRFGFINWAASVFMGCRFIELSDVEYMKNRIYFRAHDQKIHRKVFSLASNRNGQNSFYFSITPSEKAEKIYRMNWVGHSYMLKHDDENNLFYIENIEED